MPFAQSKPADAAVGGVSSVFTRTGAVVAVAGDYTGIAVGGTADAVAAGSITNAMVNATAAIAKTKLAALDIVNADVNAAAAIAQSKLAAMSTVDATIAGAVTMTTAGTFYDGPSASFAAGTWLIVWKVGLTTPTNVQTQAYTVKLWDGTIVYDESEFDTAANTTGSLTQVTGQALVTLGSPATLKLSATSARNGGTIARDVITSSASSHTASRMTGLKVG